MWRTPAAAEGHVAASYLLSQYCWTARSKYRSSSSASVSEPATVITSTPARSSASWLHASRTGKGFRCRSWRAPAALKTTFPGAWLASPQTPRLQGRPAVTGWARHATIVWPQLDPLALPMWRTCLGADQSLRRSRRRFPPLRCPRLASTCAPPYPRLEAPATWNRRPAPALLSSTVRAVIKLPSSARSAEVVRVSTTR